MKHIYKAEGLSKFKDDEDIHNNIFLMVSNTLPMESWGKYSERQVACDLCGKRHPNDECCEPIIGKLALN